MLSDLLHGRVSLPRSIFIIRLYDELMGLQGGTHESPMLRRGPLWALHRRLGLCTGKSPLPQTCVATDHP